MSGLGGDWGLTFYNASKGAVTNLTRALAMEFGSKGVRVNAVNPSLTITGMTAGMEKNKALMDKFAERIPLGRPAQPEEVGTQFACQWSVRPRTSKLLVATTPGTSIPLQPSSKRVKRSRDAGLVKSSVPSLCY